MYVCAALFVCGCVYLYAPCFPSKLDWKLQDLVLFCAALGAPAAILFRSGDACSHSIARLFAACFFFFYAVSHKSRVICCKKRSPTDVHV